MLQFPCASLNSLAELLRERYDVRSKMIVRSLSDSDLLDVEQEIIKIHRRITRHRRSCPRCKLQASRVAVNPRNLRTISAEASSSMSGGDLISSYGSLHTVFQNRGV
jgi:hypothetical protein